MFKITIYNFLMWAEVYHHLSQGSDILGFIPKAWKQVPHSVTGILDIFLGDTRAAAVSGVAGGALEFRRLWLNGGPPLSHKVQFGSPEAPSTASIGEGSSHPAHPSRRG